MELTDEQLAQIMMRGMQKMSMALLAEDLEGANAGFIEFMGTFIRALSDETITKLEVICHNETRRRKQEAKV